MVGGPLRCALEDYARLALQRFSPNASFNRMKQFLHHDNGSMVNVALHREVSRIRGRYCSDLQSLTQLVEIRFVIRLLQKC